jgi:calcineurin-like phosphoesterase family protein
MSDEKRKKIFLTSDLHIGHANVIKFDERPFRDLNHMHAVLANNYNSTVPEDGICYFLGDIGLGKGDVLRDYMSRLNGATRVLLLGNHDGGMYSMYSMGFDVVLNSATIYIGEHRVSMSHCPLPGVFREDVSQMKGARPNDHWHGEYKNHKFVSHANAEFHLHGHIHSDDKAKPRIDGNQFDCGVRANSYRPVSLSQVESWINSIKK